VLAGPRGRAFEGPVAGSSPSSIEILKEFEDGETGRIIDPGAQIEPALPSILDQHTPSWKAKRMSWLTKWATEER